jgi:tRNA(Arg) A34 adenosine deaminase TadA
MIHLMDAVEAIRLQDETYMEQAMETACQNLKRPFGALLVDTREGEVIAAAVNRSYRNPVAHGELEAIRVAGKNAKGDIRWSECTLYTTAEPCPMCMSGILWAGISRVVYGSSITTLHELGYRQIDIRAEEVIRRAAGNLTCELVGGVKESECDALFAAAIKLEKKSNG